MRDAKKLTKSFRAVIDRKKRIYLHPVPEEFINFARYHHDVDNYAKVLMCNSN